MNKLVSISMKQAAAVIIAIVMLFGGGIYAASGLKTELMPDISVPMVFITTQYPGPPQDVMEQVTKPIEKKIAGLDGLKSVASTSSDNFSTITVSLKEKADPEKKKTEIDSLLQEVKLPDSASRPKVATFGLASIPSLYLSITADGGMSQSELDQWFAKEIKPAFQALSGFDHMDEIGSRETTLRIKLDAEQLAAYGLTPPQVSNELQQVLTSAPAGSVEMNGNTLMARVKGNINSVYSLENIGLTTGAGNTVLLRQLGKIEAISESGFVARMDDKPSIGIILYKTKDANAVEFADNALQLAEDWQTKHPGIVFKTIYNSSTEVKKSIQGMLKEGITGALLAALMILLFLRNMRMTLIVLVSIPLSILITLLVMNYLNITLNILTLGGMFIAVGRVVDDSIVVIENIYSHLQKVEERSESVIKHATVQVASAITSSTLTTVGVFAPIGMVSGMAGQMFRPFAITLAVAMLASLLVALTVIPLLAKLLVLRSGKIKHEEHKEGRITHTYRKILEVTLNHRFLTLLIAGGLFIVSIVGTVPFLPITLMPENEEPRAFYYTIKMPYETSLQTTDAKVKDMERILQDAKDENGDMQFTFVQSFVGYNDGTAPLPYRAQIYTEVNEHSEVKQVREHYKTRLMAELPQGAELEARTLEGGGGGGADFQYSLKGDDQRLLTEAAAMIKEKLKEYPELKEVRDTLSDAKKELEIEVDQNKARQYGLNAALVQQTVGSWLLKDDIGDLKLDNVLYKTTLELDKSNMGTMAKLGKITFRTADGAVVYLDDIAKLKEVEAPASISRDRQEQVVTISAKIEGQNKGGISSQVAIDLDQVPLPDGVSREVGGVNADIGENFSQLFVAMGAAVFIVYLIMVVAFSNASAPFAILFSLPLAVIGGLVGLFVTGESINITSLIGFMMLIGIVVTNAILLIDRAQQLRKEGYTVRHALVEAGAVRLRPIVMTAVVTAVAMSPLALGISEGGTLISKGMAVVVIGGLTSSTILTLVVVPVVYELIESFKNRVARLFGRREKTHSSDDMLKGVMIDE